MPTLDPPVQVAHRLERRVRLRAPALALHREASRRVADRLAGEFDGHRVSVRPETGSVVVEVQTGTARAEALAERLRALLAEERDESGRPLLEPVVQRGTPSGLARAIIEAFRGVNDDVRTALDGKADLATLAPIFLAASSAFRVAKRGEIAPVPWFNLLWFAMSTFLEFNADTHVGETEPHEPTALH